ncbi:MAG: phosphate acyltransferase PlsX [Candidatus Thiodiazotropha sp. (ex Lucinoma aequizonata)]|nr:phosphate acyltransferase PlsX [Candidatus Thiodiazotropha sp. (ex Lucinoma aequizonata)]MCU7887549.1 phosphate acyltransferase PlsX [Candidatus Thiodiazotropha sp. (ex Lucinoma aequizonata)]MCU7895992.1 phosphate acyltransferase PlsX [Candidatus Thiodiazotropha sp. (ex Lucinoma aequizonata)]MCU7897172.1 phosphate acyltransferase PlsX [Candidatus Thiodiazotropha sp. (ex Lucinoma aequizonata)]MCU7901124.1 phosphate acyltransferase PlsX [Candidatus Thiodiazotropha sp. (ex Lucinoma aequizonata)
MSKPVTISLDAMGGDIGVDVVIPAALEYLRWDKETVLVLVGDQDMIKKKLGDHPFGERLHIKHASETVTMDELPSRVLRNKKDSSMRVAIDLVKSAEVNACVSAGNTGALMATSRFVLKMLPNIDRPAIISALPSIKGQTFMLDLGANVDCSAEHLFQFAVMGSETVAAVTDISNPIIGLLNIGQEEIKGNEQVKCAHELLTQSSLNYVGYVEGNDIYQGGTDVVVSDGFVGNIALKSSEGVAKMISHFIKSEFTKNPLTKLAGLLAMPVLKAFRKRIDHRRYNGASLLGLRGIVIKSHGGADKLAFMNAISIARKEVSSDVPRRIAEQVKTHMEKKEIA